MASRRVRRSRFVVGNVGEVRVRLLMKSLGLALTLALSVGSVASAQVVNQVQPYRYVVLSSTSIFSIVASQWVGVQNMAATAQTATATCFDSPTAGSLTGTALPLIGPLGISQLILEPAPGWPLYNGYIVCQLSAAPVGGGVAVLAR